MRTQRLLPVRRRLPAHSGRRARTLPFSALAAEYKNFLDHIVQTVPADPGAHLTAQPCSSTRTLWSALAGRSSPVSTCTSFRPIFVMKHVGR